MSIQRNKHRPIYLHYLDRELRRAENANYYDELVSQLITIAVINSISYCYCSASLLYESNLIFPKSIRLLIELEKYGLVRLITNEHSRDEFIVSRQGIYAHKPKRYPMYFGKDASILWPQNPIIVSSSTTSNLRNNILQWLESSTTENIDKRVFNKDELISIESKLKSKNRKAITLDLFLNPKQLKTDAIRRTTGRLISYYYTKRYIELYDGDILCKLPQIQFYDCLSANPALNDFQVISFILASFNFGKIFESKGRFCLEKFIGLIKSPVFAYIQNELWAIIQGMNNIVQSKYDKDINTILYQFKRLANISVINKVDNLDSASQIVYHDMALAAKKFMNTHELFREGYNMEMQSLSRSKKILIVTSTYTEATVVMSEFKKKGIVITHIEVDKIVYWNLGQFKNFQLIMIKTGMGSTSSIGSSLTIKEAVTEIKPDYVIMAGIAFGLNKTKQKIGQILISRELENYEAAKITENGTIQRGHNIPAGPTLMSRCEAAALVYDKVPIEFGLIISGDKLVDSESFVKKLKDGFPEAIGGEMEGTGLQSTCHRAGIEWILIKGICDWGYDKQTESKENDQKIAITNVCDYLLYVFNTFDF